MVWVRLVVVQNVEQARPIGQGENVKGQRKASEEGEEEFHVREIRR